MKIDHGLAPAASPVRGGVAQPWLCAPNRGQLLQPTTLSQNPRQND